MNATADTTQAKQAECDLCEDEHFVCKGFDLSSAGRPEIVPCPACSPAASQE